MRKNTLDELEKAVIDLHCECKKVEQLQEQLKREVSNQTDNQQEQDIFLEIYEKTIKKNKYQWLRVKYTIIIISLLLIAVYDWGKFFNIKEVQEIFTTSVGQDMRTIVDIVSSQSEFWIGTICVIGYIAAMIMFSQKEKDKIRHIKKDLSELNIINEDLKVVCDLEKDKGGLFNEIFKGSGVYFIFTFFIATSQGIVATAMFNVLNSENVATGTTTTTNNPISIEQLIIGGCIILILIVIPLMYGMILIIKYICIAPYQKRNLAISFIMQVYKEQKISSIKASLDSAMKGTEQKQEGNSTSQDVGE